MLYESIVIALEGLPEEAALIHHAVRLQESLGSSLGLVHVNDPSAGKASMMMGSLPLVREQDLREMVLSAGYPELAETIEVQILEDEAYASSIAGATADADLLILGHHHKSQFMAALVDSTDERLADLASCPILLLPLEA